MAPSTQKQWQVVGTGSFDNLKVRSIVTSTTSKARFNNFSSMSPLKYRLQATTMSLSASAVLRSTTATSSLPRYLYPARRYISSLTLSQGGYPFPQRDGVVPASDAAGEIVAVGSKVKLWKTGDKVLTLFNQGHLAGAVDQISLGGGVGGVVDGGLQQYGVFNEYGVVRQPSNLNDVESASLTCAGLTAWNALYGVEGKKLMPGQWVLTQGTGGVSIFALQFAKAAGARVISTTSSKDKMDKLKKLGADHVINYKEDENWGETAKKLTGGVGVDHVIEVGGPSTTRNSLKAIKFEGIISIIGYVLHST